MQAAEQHRALNLWRLATVASVRRDGPDLTARQMAILLTAYLTPPMAPSIFYLRGIAPPSISLHDMYVGIWPFIGLQLVVIALIIAFPDVVTWLPTTLTQAR